ncbi:MAG: TIGR02117 family protein [Planctomycetes bacterium]|nr:TIGR02117 family protein [Planctomycetota bacterium]
MRRITVVLRWLKRAAAALLGLLLLYGAAVVALPRVAVNGDWQPPASGITIGVLSNGVHTDLVLPATTAVIDWTSVVPRRDFAAVDEQFEWVAFGWGSRDFYLETPTWRDLRFTTALQSVSGFAASALHVSWRWTPPASDERGRVVVLSEAQYRTLVDGVLAAFARDESGAARLIAAPGYTPYDRFYEAHGHYSAITTCNEWTGALLRGVGVKVGCWTPWASDVLRFLPR